MSKPLNKKHQIISVLSSIANVNMNLAGNSEKELQQNAFNKIKKVLKSKNPITKFIGEDWQLVWGPHTTNSSHHKPFAKKKPTWVTDNLVYVAKSDKRFGKKHVYVVGVAGTNPISTRGWIVEDANVGKKVAWGKLGQGKISKGTHIGLEALLTTPSKEEQAITNSKEDVISFLKGAMADDANAEIATCGHSLGGALSPLMALKIRETFPKKHFETIDVSCYPSAGDTSGDKTFVKHFEKQIDKDHYHSVINEYDVVPHAWEIEMLEKIKSIYEAPFNLKTPIAIRLAIDAVIKSLKNKEQDYTRIWKAEEYRFQGVLLLESLKFKKLHPFAHLMRFASMAGYQHTTAYGRDGFQLTDEVNEAIEKFLDNKPKQD